MTILEGICTALVVVTVIYCLIRVSVSERRISKLEEEVFRVRDRFRVLVNQVRDVVAAIMDQIKARK